ncbi:MAG: hypothetical protein RLZZ214_3564, partial [Verrucomicrobiota bacterium]
MTNAKHSRAAPKLAKARLAPANLTRRLGDGGFILDSMMVRLAGVAEPSLGIHPQGIVGLENLAELLRGFPMKRGDFRQARAESGDGGLATYLLRKTNVCGKSRFGCKQGCG